jgi:hypothetical protein
MSTTLPLPFRSAAIYAAELSFASGTDPRAPGAFDVGARLFHVQLLGYPDDPGCFLLPNSSGRSPPLCSGAATSSERSTNVHTAGPAESDREEDLPMIAVSYRMHPRRPLRDPAPHREASFPEGLSELNLVLSGFVLGAGTFLPFLLPPPCAPPPPRCQPDSVQSDSDNIKLQEPSSPLGLRITARNCAVAVIGQPRIVSPPPPPP